MKTWLFVICWGCSECCLRHPPKGLALITPIRNCICQESRVESNMQEWIMPQHLTFNDRFMGTSCVSTNTRNGVSRKDRWNLIRHIPTETVLPGKADRYITSSLKGHVPYFILEEFRLMTTLFFALQGVWASTIKAGQCEYSILCLLWASRGRLEQTNIGKKVFVYHRRNISVSSILGSDDIVDKEWVGIRVEAFGQCLDISTMTSSTPDISISIQIFVSMPL